MKSKSDDPEYWEEILRNEGLSPLSHEEAVIPLQEGIAREIADKLSGLGERVNFLGMPNEYNQLKAWIAHTINSLKKESSDPICIALRNSCTNREPTVVIYNPRGQQHHINLGEIENFNEGTLRRHISESYNLTIKDIRNYTQES